MNNLISVIIPVYNTSKYLVECIDSIVNQTYREIEIIIVDDGSTDGSADICDEYAKKDSRIKVIHKNNGGQSSARNVGIDKASGGRLIFIDSDDFVTLDHISYLDHMYRNHSVQVVCTPLVMRYANGKCGRNNSFDAFIADGLTAKELSLRGYHTGVSSSGKLFETSLFKKFQFPEGEIYEDLKIIPFVLKEADKVLFSDYASYFYNQHPKSTMHSNSVISTDRMISFYQQLINNAETEEIRNAAILRMETNVKVHCWRMKPLKNRKDIKKFIRVLKQYKNEFMSDKLNSKKEKMKYRFLSSNVVLFYFFYFAQRIKIKIKEE